jgi:hypothetical protein
MKKMLLVLMILAFAATTAMAFPSSIGMYADDQAGACDITPFPTYVSTNVYFFANLDPGEFAATSAVQFKVDNTPGPAAALVTPAWNTPLAIGSWDEDLALAFSPVLDGPLAFLGSVGLFALADFGADYVMTVMPAISQTDILIVNGAGDVTLPASGGQITFNCSGTCTCSTATDDGSWSSIKALY